VSAERAQLSVAGDALYGVTGADINGDGCGDLLTWDGWVPDDPTFFGAVWAIESPMTGEQELRGPGVTAGILGDQSDEVFGYAAQWGDVDGDGTFEVVASAGGGPPLAVGSVRIIDLPEAGTAVSSDAWAVLAGAGDWTGKYLDLGDTDGDGYLDLAITDWAPDTVDNPDGMAVYLHRGPITTSKDLADADTTIYEVEGHGMNLGNSLHASVDLDGDGSTELIMGQHRAPHMDESGRAYVFDGSISGLVSEEAAELTLFGERPFSHLGRSLSTGGDVDGDGHPELLVSAPHETTGSHGGKVYLFYGPPDETWSTDTPGATIATYEESAGMGNSVSIDADLDGDGRADIAVGASHSLAYSPGLGAVFLFYEALSGTVMVHPDADAVIYSTDPEVHYGLGSQVSGVGDLDGDGHDELYVGSVLDPTAYIFYGGP